MQGTLLNKDYIILPYTDVGNKQNKITKRQSYNRNTKFV